MPNGSPLAYPVSVMHDNIVSMVTWGGSASSALRHELLRTAY